MGQIANQRQIKDSSDLNRKLCSSQK